MMKKLMLLAMAVGALVAFAVPAAASATTGQLTEGGKSLVAPVTVLATSTNVTTKTEIGSLVCGKVTLDLNVTKNGATGSAGSGTGTATGCHTESPEIPVTITKITVSSISLGSSGSGAFTYTYDIPLLGLEDCNLGGTVPITWTAGTSSLHIAGSVTGGGGSASCPKTGTIAGDFSVETANGTAVVVD